MDKYEVVIRDRRHGNKWSMYFSADDFGHAEEQAIDTLESGNTNLKEWYEFDEIIRIDKEYGELLETGQTNAE